MVMPKRKSQADEPPGLLKDVFAWMAEQPETDPALVAQETQPGVVILPSQDQQPEDYVTCQICGTLCKALKGHLARNHMMTTDKYLKMFGLTPDQLVAPSYVERRRQLASKAGLGGAGGWQLTKGQDMVRGIDDGNSEKMAETHINTECNANLFRRIDELKWSTRVANCLNFLGVTYVGELAQMQESELLRTPNLGRHALNEIKASLEAIDLTIGMQLDGWPPDNLVGNAQHCGQIALSDILDLSAERSAYTLLNPIEQQVLQFLSILMEQTHRTNLAKCLRQAGVMGCDGKAMGTVDLGTIIDRLVKMDLVDIDPATSMLFACAPCIANYATQAAIREGRFESMLQTIQKEFPIYNSHYYSPGRINSYIRAIREMRISIFAKDPEQLTKIIESCQTQYSNEMALEHPLITICDSPCDIEWFCTLTPAIQAEALNVMVPNRLEQFADVTDLLPLLEKGRHDPNGFLAALFCKHLLTIKIFQGRLAEAQTILNEGKPCADAPAMQAWIHFLRGEHEVTIRLFEQLLKTARKVTDKRRHLFEEFSGIFFLLALLKSEDPTQRVRLTEYLELPSKKPKIALSPRFTCLSATMLFSQNKTADAKQQLDPIAGKIAYTGNGIVQKQKTDSSLTKIFKGIARFWIDKEYAIQKNTDFRTLFDQARQHGHRWAAMELAELLAAMEVDPTTHAEYAALIRRESGMQSLLAIMTREENWERALKALILMGGHDTPDTRTACTSRLIWMIEYSKSSVIGIQPREQTHNVTGQWSKGRQVALKRLFSQSADRPDFLTEQDLRICAAIHRNPNYYGESYEWHLPQAMLAMVGHPLVFWMDALAQPVEVVKEALVLVVSRKGGQVGIRFSESVTMEGTFAYRDSPTRCRLVEITKAHTRIAEILGGKTLQVPAIASGQVMNAIRAIAPLVTIHSGLEGGIADVDELPADARPHILLWPNGNGLRIALQARPFSGEGPYFPPGKGGKTIIAEINSRRVQTHRNLKEEAARAKRVIDACPNLLADEGQNEWLIEEPETCLELLLELQALSAEEAVIAWPEGEKIQVSRPLAMDGLRVRIQREEDWFAINGELTVDEDLVLDMHRLLELARGRESRFLPLGEGRFLALTESFRKRLAEIDAFSDSHAGGQRFHHLASPILRDILEQAGKVEEDAHWRKQLQRIDLAQAVEPDPPSMLQAELREYQLAGFHWLTRLAVWGVGGCLADDMGLGKTLQALALLLYRAQEGPSLVVAPVSVGMNWLKEIERFAPTLRGILFGGSSRQQILEGLQPFNVVICSYGLLQQEAEMLVAMRWNVIVLDEAQAIKNRLTKRSQAAMALTGSVRIVTTGTPMENHLGELWNLFQFINPGLLGSLERFNERFAAPIERNADKGAQKRLQKLIRPFLLRRTKNQVLEELPSRTEIVLHVELSEEEMAFYETLRRQAIAQIEEFAGPPEQQRFRILAEIMRLRRACCHSQLVLPDSPLESSKLALFWEVTEELLENKHKALVFSQFVDHLAILRALLDEKGVNYQYLDGSTPAKERQRRVDAFQAGEGDVFLISLKAGGVGINLTAADYVIHMDPWWNPAVEDQASDRAHRIGQKRPVTIYRLVAKETIEEKIVALHRHKRDLADGLLEGGEMSGKLSLEELFDLVRSGIS
ncbi:MAG: MucR family transcriptional regulator [Magnetococcales bacterium]|nr:MucR family transcriptional regulator [Magnetococcales bacterium]